MHFRRRSCRAAIFVGALLTACGPDLPGEFLGQSVHFRLFVEPELRSLHPTFTADQGLAALETSWSDTKTLLQMPEGKARIDYHWTIPDQASISCGAGSGPVIGCKLENLAIVSTLLPHQHELNHAYMELRTHRRVVPIVSEGMAEALGCGVTMDVPAAKGYVPWQAMVAIISGAPNFQDIYDLSGGLARYLIRTGGLDAFLAYYQQAPEIRDPAVFVDNFSRFWGTSVDEVWSAMYTERRRQFRRDSMICPCSLPPLVTDGVQPPPHDLARAPYTTLPPGGGMTLALRSNSITPLKMASCLGTADTVMDVPSFILARLEQPSYVVSPVQSAVFGNFLSDSCEQATTYRGPAHLGAHLGLQVEQSTVRSTDGYLYLRVQIPATSGISRVSVFSGALTLSTCGTCAFDTAACQAVGYTVPLGMTTLLRIPLAAGASGGSAPNLGTLQFH